MYNSKQSIQTAFHTSIIKDQKIGLKISQLSKRKMLHRQDGYQWQSHHSSSFYDLVYNPSNVFLLEF